MRGVVLLVALLACGFGPFGSERHPVTRDARAERAVAPHTLPRHHFLYLPFRFYQTVVSPMDGPRCSHHPTCSAYALEAVRRRGFLHGLMLTVDRLWMTEQSSPLRVWPLVRIGDRLRLHHPLEAETFWLDGVFGEASWPDPDEDLR